MMNIKETQTNPTILDLSHKDLIKEFIDRGDKKYRADQVWRSLYKDGVRDFGEITTLSKPLRKSLDTQFTISPLSVETSLTSSDSSTTKKLFKLHDGELIETVLMRYEPDGHRKNRKTVCVSTQAGCALGCTFCATGQQGFRRNLRVSEIVDQVIVAISDGDNKKYLFTIEERIKIVNKALFSDLKFKKNKVKVISFNSLTTDLCKKYKSNIILRGLRAVSDFEYEFQLAGMNRKLNKNIETIFLMSDVQNQIISSRLIKEIIELKGDIKKFTTKSTINSLKKKYE